MKKILMLAVILVISGTALYSHEPDTINEAVQKTFNKSFSDATNIKWERVGRYYRAHFRTGSEWVYAYFSSDGEQVALSRKITQEQLPLNLSTLLSEKLNEGSLTDLFEVLIDGQTTYYTTIRNSKYSVLYKGTASGRWQVFKKTKHHS